MIASTTARTAQVNLMSRQGGITGLCRTKPQTPITAANPEWYKGKVTHLESPTWLNQWHEMTDFYQDSDLFGWLVLLLQYTNHFTKEKEHTTDNQTFLSSPFQTWLFRQTLRFCYRTKSVPEQTQVNCCKQDPNNLFPVWDVALRILDSKTDQQ